MSRRRPTGDERAERQARRIVERAIRAGKVQAQREWLEERVLAAAKRAQLRKAAPRPGRGVDRVPDHLRDLYVTVAPHEKSKHGTPIDSTLGVFRGKQAPYATRRAMGQRGHVRKPRKRELPGAQVRRLERRRKEWLEKTP